MVLDPILVTKGVHWIPLNFNGSRKRWMLLFRFPLDWCYIQTIKEKPIQRPNAHLFLRLYHAADVWRCKFSCLNWEWEQWYRVQLNFTGLWMGEIMFHLMTAVMPKETWKTNACLKYWDRDRWTKRSAIGKLQQSLYLLGILFLLEIWFVFSL